MFFKKDKPENTDSKPLEVEKEQDTLFESYTNSEDDKPTVDINAIRNSLSSLDGASADINSSIVELSSRNAEQSEDISSASEMLKDFNNHMEDLANNIVNVQIKVFDTEKTSSEGLSAIKELDESLTELQSAFSVSNSTVTDLVEKLESVNVITDSISQIATQTNLLALNAAIEAARAGEAGRGFSVVAGEVRKLAENSKVAVQNITKILEEIKIDILNTSEAINNGNVALTAQSNSIEKSQGAFNNIKSSIDEAKEEIDSCILNLSTTSEKKNMIVNKVEAISKIAEENSALSQEIAAASETTVSVIEDITSQLNK